MIPYFDECYCFNHKIKQDKRAAVSAQRIGGKIGLESKNLSEFMPTSAGKKHLTNWQVCVLRFLKKEKVFL